MSRRRSAPRWPRVVLIAGLAVLALLLMFLFVRLLVGAVGRIGAGGVASEPDPQFAQPAEAVTRPPELDGSGEPVALADDPSLGWVYEAQSPVDKTAEELSREEAAAN